MISSRPYLLRAFYDWIVDNHTTPYIIVDAEMPGVQVPKAYVEGGRIVLNISPMAVRDFDLSKTHVTFNASFGVNYYDVVVPVKAITAIYAQENGRGMVFKDDEDDEDEEGPDDEGPTTESAGKKGGRPNLTVVK